MGYFDKNVWDYVPFDVKDEYERLEDEPYMKYVNSVAENYAPNLAEETFYGLYSPICELEDDVPDSLKVEQKLIRKAMETKGWEDLQKRVSGDGYATMLGLNTFCTEIIKNLPEDVKDDLEKNQQAQQQAKQAQQQAEKTANDPKATNRQKQAAQQAAQQAQQAAQQALQQALNRIGQSQSQIENASFKAVEKTNQDLKDASEELDTFGCGSGRKPMTKNDIDSIKKLKDMFKNNKRLRHLLDLIGAMKRVVAGERKKCLFGRESIVSYKRREINVDTIVPTELMGLCAPDGSPLRKLFLMKAADNALMHYEYEGEAEAGKGPMILLKDTSGSMMGDRFEIATAIELALVRQMVKDKRRCITIPFSGTDDYKVCEVSENPNLMEILENASINYEGGTSPYEPLETAIDIILEKQDYRKAGILIITDGEFTAPPPGFLEKLERARQNPGVYISAICIGNSLWGNIQSFANTTIGIGDFYSSFNDDENIGKAIQGIL